MPELEDIKKKRREGHLCPRCSTIESDLSAQNCGGCGETLLKLLRANYCPSCGTPGKEQDICIRCGHELLLFLPENIYPTRPYGPELRPVILARELGNELQMPLEMVHEDSVPQAAPVNIHGMTLTIKKDQMSGTPRNHIKLKVGAAIKVYARGIDDKGKWFRLPKGVTVKWRGDRELEVRPLEGDEVTVKLVGIPKVAAWATARTKTPGGRRIKKIVSVQPKK